MDKDYRVTVKVRNNRLLKAIELSGHKSGQAFASLIDAPYTALNDLINMTIGPLTQQGEEAGQYRGWVIRLCEFLNKSPADLFSEEQLEPLGKNTSEFYLDHTEMMSLRLIDSSDAAAVTSESYMRDRVIEIVETLSPLEQSILTLRFGLDGHEHSQEEVGHLLNTAQDRIRQIEGKALRKLRHPKRANWLRSYLDE
ncbi:sigma factor-like helix-turn-helix DNA-binding protein [uncultured Nevskia sp.]|uniref:sigma factor-like helix-turn-helix DNA-binding protein n=1 Tax=uncultured Nevskia sp. TaxID=228950 RepID=UPI0025EC70C1|nr:sigma factor-like helix-turn-helix DNA-binding protein [uncultured Nevskia sp.]